MYIQDSQLKGLYQRERTTGNKWVVKAKQRGINKPVTVTLGLVTLRYNTINDAIEELGSTASIKDTFVGFQKYLYL